MGKKLNQVDYQKAFFSTVANSMDTSHHLEIFQNLLPNLVLLLPYLEHNNTLYL